MPRDNGSLFSGDFSGINLDTYGDARNNIFLASNLYGSQFDAIRLEGTGYGGSPYNMNVNANFDFKSLGKETEYGYEMEFIIPFSELPFPNGTNQRWKIDIYTGYPDTLVKVLKLEQEPVWKIEIRVVSFVCLIILLL